MAVSYKVGTGGDYADLVAAYAAMPDPFTEDVTFNMLGETFTHNPAVGGATIDINKDHSTYSLTIKPLDASVTPRILNLIKGGAMNVLQFRLQFNTFMNKAINDFNTMCDAYENRILELTKQVEKLEGNNNSAKEK